MFRKENYVSKENVGLGLRDEMFRKFEDVVWKEGKVMERERGLGQRFLFPEGDLCI